MASYHEESVIAGYHYIQKGDDHQWRIFRYDGAEQHVLLEVIGPGEESYQEARKISARLNRVVSRKLRGR